MTFETALQGYHPPYPASRGYDGLSLIAHDHEHIRALFREYEDVSARWDPHDVRALARHIIRDVSAHASAEERYLYPLIRGKLPTAAKNMVYERNLMDYRVNKEAMRFIERCLALTDDALIDWNLLHMTILKFIVVEEEHLAEEEECVLAPLRAVLTDDDKRALFENIYWAKQHGPTHPHREAPPATEYLAKFAHPLAGVVDTINDRVTGFEE